MFYRVLNMSKVLNMPAFEYTKVRNVLLALDSGHWTLDPGRWTLDTGFWKLNSGRWTVHFGR